MFDFLSRKCIISISIKINMEIKYIKENKTNIREINFYLKDFEKKENIQIKKYFNIKITDGLDRRKFISLIRSVVVKLKKDEINEIVFDYNQIKKIKINALSDFERAKIFIENLFLAEYKFDKYLSEKKGRIKNILILGNFSAEEKKAFQEGEIVSAGMNKARDLANTPGSEMTPNILLLETKKMFSGLKNIKISVIDEKQAKKLKMNLFLAVSRGSDEPGKIIIVEYQAGKKTAKKISLLGKGITYDTGGLSLKPASAMFGMEKDMTGSAVVLATLYSVAKLELKKNVVVVATAVENAISARAYKPGDLLKSMSGITVEVKNTDAEGRLVLAEALTYIAQKIKPAEIIDVATLTGASLVAIGEKASIVMTRNQEMENKIRLLGEKTGDYIWPLPLWDEFETDIKGKLADIANTGKNKYGGTITAGIFLYQFIKKEKNIKWAHLDIAPRMDSAEGDNLEYGATGEPVRLLVEYVKQFN